MSDIVIFPGNFYDKLKNGEATMIFTTYDTRLPVRVHDCIPCVFKGLDDSMLLEIIDFGYKNFGALSLDDALKCGFDSVNDLKKSLVERYVTLDNSSRIYSYVFEVIGFSEKVVEA